MRGWLSRIDKDSKKARDKRIFDLWLACHTQAEIAETVAAPQRTVADVVKGFSENGRLAESAKATASHATDFEPPIYNIWKQQEKTAGAVATHAPQSSIYGVTRIPTKASRALRRQRRTLVSAATALTLATDGKRENGRWERGAVKGTEPTNSGSANNSWSCRMRDAGLVFDYLGAERLKHVANGQEALDAAAQINSMPTTTQLRLSLALG